MVESESEKPALALRNLTSVAETLKAEVPTNPVRNVSRVVYTRSGCPEETISGQRDLGRTAQWL